MGRKLKAILFIVLTLIVGVSWFWWRTMSWTGELTTLSAHYDGTCESVEGIYGAEDIVIDHENNLAYVSSHDRRNPETKGSIWVLPTNAPGEAHALTLTGYDAERFSPHGVDLWVGADGVRRLFVIDHGDWSLNRVVIFRVEDDALVFERAIANPLIKRPNDIAAASQSAFYVTNDLGAGYDSQGEFFEVLFRQVKGNLVYHDGSKASIVADKIGYANGVAVSNDGSSVYLGAIIDQSVRFFSRDVASGALTLVDEIVLGTGVDNIDVDEEGVLWIGAHPKLLTFSKHAKNEADRSPSQIIRADPVNKTIKEIYLSHGDPLSGASVGAHSDGTLLIGGVFDPRVLVCTNDKPAP